MTKRTQVKMRMDKAGSGGRTCLEERRAIKNSFLKNWIEQVFTLQVTVEFFLHLFKNFVPFPCQEVAIISWHLTFQ